MTEAVESLLGIEKAQRLAEDVTGTRLACTAVLDVLFDAKDWPGINEHVILLSKRRSQLKQARALINSAPLEKQPGMVHQCTARQVV